MMLSQSPELERYIGNEKSKARLSEDVTSGSGFFIFVFVIIFMITVSKISFSSSSDSTLYNSGTYYIINGRYSEALKCFQQLVETGSDTQLILLGQLEIGVCYSLVGRNEDAINEFKKLENDFPDTGTVYVALMSQAHCYTLLQNDTEAIKCYEKNIKKISPDSETLGLVYLNIGVCYQHLKDFELASNIFKKIINELPQTRAAIKARGFLNE